MEPVRTGLNRFFRVQKVEKWSKLLLRNRFKPVLEPVLTGQNWLAHGGTRWNRLESVRTGYKRFNRFFRVQKVEKWSKVVLRKRF